jgi:hypothetical protein
VDNFGNKTHSKDHLNCLFSPNKRAFLKVIKNKWKVLENVCFDIKI